MDKQLSLTRSIQICNVSDEIRTPLNFGDALRFRSEQNRELIRWADDGGADERLQPRLQWQKPLDRPQRSTSENIRLI